MSNWKFHWLTKWDEVWDSSFLDNWNKWMEESPSAHVFFHPAVVRAWFEAYINIRDMEPRFLVAEDHNEGIAFLPLIFDKVKWKDAWLKSILPVGYNEFDYHDPIVSGDWDESKWTGFWDGFDKEIGKSTFDIVRINGIRNGYISESLFSNTTDKCPYIDLSKYQSGQEFIHSLKSKLRIDVQRQRKRLEEQGNLCYHVFSTNEKEEALRSLCEILNEHTRKWPNSYKAPGFHDKLVTYSLSEGLLHLSEMRLDDKPISWHVGFLYRERFYWYLPVYKSEYSQYSPGKVHLYFCIEDAIKKKASIYDFLRGDEDYKSSWAKENISIYELTWQSKRLTSQFRNICVKKIKPMLRRMNR
jgi:CelD/BcsL family acetyltransferase involved in cellulose biosynthesis